MQNFISLVNKQLYREEESPHRHVCHDPPHAARVGLYDDKSPPRRLGVVARPAPGKHHLLRWDSQAVQCGGEDCHGHFRSEPWRSVLNLLGSLRFPR